jgi:hypothetical protein
MTNQMENPTGIGAPAMATMRTGATENAALATAHAQQANNLAAAVHGGNGLPSGVAEQITANTNNAGAALDASGQNQITMQDENLKNENYWKAVQGLSGTAQLENPNAYAQDANSGAGEVAGLSQAYTESNKSQLLGALGGAVGGAATGWATGGFKIPGGK